MSYNYFTENQEDLTILGGNVPNLVHEGFCSDILESFDTIEINVHMNALGIEGAVLYIKYFLFEEVIVAVAKADDLEEPSSLSAYYKGSLFGKFTVEITSTNNAVIPAKSLQIAIKETKNVSPSSRDPTGC